jgi:hypothetical protein
MGFVVKRPSRMQEQKNLFSGRTGICFRAGLKKSGRGQKFRGEGCPPPGSDTRIVRREYFNVPPTEILMILNGYVVHTRVGPPSLFSFSRNERGELAAHLQMSQSSLRNHRLKYKVSEILPIILEEVIEYTSN